MWELYPFSIAMLLLIMAFQFILAARVGSARGKYNVKAPACEGPDEFNRVYRVHQNTLEQIVQFLPLFVVFTIVAGDIYGAITGLIWLVGRFIYMRAYEAGPEKRGLGMIITVLASVICFFGIIVVAVMRYAF